MSKYPVQVLTRMTEEQASRLDEVMRMGAPLKDRPSAVRRLIDSVGDDDVRTADAAEGKEAGAALAAEDVVAVLAALDERTRAYSELAKQVRHVGHFLNTLTKLGHQIAKYGKAAAIPTAAIAFAQRKVDGVLEQMSALAEQDERVEAVLRSCRS